MVDTNVSEGHGFAPMFPVSKLIGAEWFPVEWSAIKKGDVFRECDGFGNFTSKSLRALVDAQPDAHGNNWSVLSEAV